MFIYYSFDVVLSKIFLNQEGPGGRVYLISSKTGKILNQFPVPLNRESWSVPIYFKHDNQHHVIYGSGGERKNGYIQSSNILTGKLNWLVEVPEKGALSSPMLYKENGEPVVVTNTMGVTSLKLMPFRVRFFGGLGLDLSLNLTLLLRLFVLKVNPPTILLLFFLEGVWPKYESASLFILDGQTGESMFEQKIGFCNGASSPLVTDLDDDQLDDILMVTCTSRQPRLLILNNDLRKIFSEPLDSGGFSTPVVDDLDNDGFTDIIVPRFHFISRFRTKDQRKNPLILKWNQYRGVHWNGTLD